MPRKTLQQRRERELQRQREQSETFGFEGELKKSPTARVEELKRLVEEANTTDPEEIMLIIMEVFNQTVTPIPDPGNFYTFVYNAKTPNIQFDSNPLVAVTDVFEWGFRGVNLHIGQYRNYTYNELVGQLYEVNPDELSDVRELPFVNITLNN